MPTSLHRPANSYSPLCFLGAGGPTVTFFMLPFFRAPHPAQPVPVFEGVPSALSKGDLPLQPTIAIAWSGIAVFAFLNLKYLAWNLTALRGFRRTPDNAALPAG